MIEILLVVVALTALVTLAFVPWTLLFEFGVAMCLLGLLVGVPTGLVYHVRLRSALLSAGALPDRWWVSPVQLHRHIPSAWRPRVMPWFYAGGVGFILTALGCGLWLLAVPGSLGWVREG